MSKVEKRDTINKDNPLKFKLSELVEFLESHSISTSAELRQMRQLGIINYKVISQHDGLYQLKNLGNGKTNKTSITKMLENGEEILLQRSKPKPGHILNKLLHVVSNRNLPKTPTESEENT